MTSHAYLSASGSSKWINCPPSAALEQRFPDKGSVFAAEGTKAHDLAEKILKSLIGGYDFKPAPEISTAMIEAVQTYVDIVMEKYAMARKFTPDAQILIESRLDFSEWVPKGFGTGDTIIITDGNLEIIDLKYGTGVPVDAYNNSQMRLYALGAYYTYGMLYECRSVTMTIVQPRLDNITSETLMLEDLLAWGDMVKPIAAKAFKGEGEYCAGAHCKFCRAACRCKCLADYNLEVLKYDFQEADMLDDKDISYILGKAKMLENWLKNITSYALTEALEHDKHWPGYKVVLGKSKRVITEPSHLTDILRAEGYQTADIIKPTEIRGITELEKLTGKAKFKELSTGCIEKQPGKPTLVPWDDARPEWQPNQEIINQFEED